MNLMPIKTKEYTLKNNDTTLKSDVKRIHKRLYRATAESLGLTKGSTALYYGSNLGIKGARAGYGLGKTAVAGTYRGMINDSQNVGDGLNEMTSTGDISGNALNVSIDSVKREVGRIDRAATKRLSHSVTSRDALSLSPARRNLYRKNYQLARRKYIRYRAGNLKSIQALKRLAMRMRANYFFRGLSKGFSAIANSALGRAARTVFSAIRLILHGIITAITTLFGSVLPMIAVAIIVITIISAISGRASTDVAFATARVESGQIVLNITVGGDSTVFARITAPFSNNGFVFSEDSGGSSSRLEGVIIGEDFRITGTYRGSYIVLSGRYSPNMNLNGQVAYNSEYGDERSVYFVAGKGILSPPLPPGSYYVGHGFGYRGYIGISGASLYHQGVDIFADMGTPLLSAGDGTVIDAGYHWAAGGFVTIDHGNGIWSEYCHQKTSGIVVRKGEKVKSGQVIGHVASEGVSGSPHLHYVIYQNGKPVDPSAYLGQYFHAGYNGTYYTVEPTSKENKNEET